MTEFKTRYAITFGEVAILHVGGKEFGNGIRENGFSINELKQLKTELGNYAKFISISDNLPENLTFILPPSKPKKEIISEGTEMSDRFKKLAGLIK